MRAVIDFPKTCYTSCEFIATVLYTTLVVPNLASGKKDINLSFYFLHLLLLSHTHGSYYYGYYYTL